MNRTNTIVTTALFAVNLAINCLHGNWPAAFNALAVCFFVWVLSSPKH